MSRLAALIVAAVAHAAARPASEAVAPQAVLLRAVCAPWAIPPDGTRLAIAAWAAGATDNRQIMPTEMTAESVVVKRTLSPLLTYLCARAVCMKVIQTDARHLGTVRTYCRRGLSG